MVDFVSTLGVVTSFIANVLNLSFFGFGTFGNFVLVLSSAFACWLCSPWSLGWG